MSMISFVVCALFLISIISALPAPGSVLYSAVIRNKQATTAHCIITWSERKLADSPIDYDVVTIPSNQFKIIEEKTYDVGLWQAISSIQKIQCGTLTLTAPFPKVTSIERLWEFHLESNAIVSVGPSLEKPSKK